MDATSRGIAGAAVQTLSGRMGFQKHRQGTRRHASWCPGNGGVGCVAAASPIRAILGPVVTLSAQGPPRHLFYIYTIVPGVSWGTHEEPDPSHSHSSGCRAHFLDIFWTDFEWQPTGNRKQETANCPGATSILIRLPVVQLQCRGQLWSPGKGRRKLSA